MRRSVALLALVLCGFHAGCDRTPKGEAPAVSASSPSQVSPRDAFAFKLYEEIGKNERNFVIAPAALSELLAVMHKGAKGPTADEMLAVLGPEPGAKALDTATIAGPWMRPEAKEAELLVANRVWVDRGLKLSPEFQALADKPDGPVGLLDFRGAPDQARVAMQTWAKERTKDKAGDPAWASTVDEHVRVLLTSATTFTGKWRTKFDPNRTRLAPFEYQKHAEGMVPTMINTFEAGYAVVDGVEVLELPTEKGDLSFLIMMPQEGYSVAGVESALAAGKLGPWRSQLKPAEREVTLPRVTVTSHVAMARPLATLGMSKLLNPGADLSGLGASEGGAMTVAEVAQKAVVALDEDGTAPATPNVKVEPVKPIDLTKLGEGKVVTNRTEIKRPFVFALVDTKTGSLLLLGRFVKP